MTHRHTLTALFAIALTIGAGSLLALERATFILSNGERVSGEVVFHTEAHTNIRADKNEFNLKTNDGIEMPIPFAQVIAIDFVGGQPSADELQAIPDSGHMLALRNGQFRRGKLIDLVNGDTVRWERATGGQMDIPIAQVARIYLQPDRSREVFNAPQASASTPSAGGGFGRAGRRNRAANAATSANLAAMTTLSTVTVKGTDAFIDTAITVRRGDMMGFQPSGRVFFARGPAQGTTAAGDEATMNPQFPVPELGAGALIGKVGPNGAPFAIGAGDQPVQMPASGRLMLGINDTIMTDNSGSFRVIIKR